MGDRERVQLLLWRAGMGATPAQVDAETAKGYAAAVDDILNYPDAPASVPDLPAFPAQPKKQLSGDERTQLAKQINQANQQGMQIISGWWADQMRTSPSPLQENLTLFWHNHFATADYKVRRPAFMLQQNQLFRAQGAGKFVDLLMAVSKDPAMLIWLDNRTNVTGHPNENWAREVMELFTLGIGNYTEDDVREAARACTGWTLSYDGQVTFVPKRFDAGQKTILGQTGNFNMDDFSRLLTGMPQNARFISTKLFRWFLADDPSDAELQPMIDTWNQTGGEIRGVLKTLFLSDAFTPQRAATAHIKNPASWTIGVLRGLEVDVPGQQVAQSLTAQGMQLFNPPNVGGWPSGPAWISPSSQVFRFNMAGAMTAKADTLAGTVDDNWMNELSDRLGSLSLSDDIRGELTALGDGTNGRRAVTQVVVAGPDFQAR